MEDSTTHSEKEVWLIVTTTSWFVDPCSRKTECYCYSKLEKSVKLLVFDDFCMMIEAKLEIKIVIIIQPLNIILKNPLRSEGCISEYFLL